MSASAEFAVLVGNWDLLVPLVAQYVPLVFFLIKLLSIIHVRVTHIAI